MDMSCESLQGVMYHVSMRNTPIISKTTAYTKHDILQMRFCCSNRMRNQNPFPLHKGSQEQGSAKKHKKQRAKGFSPPARWGLLDFMSTPAPSPPSPPPPRRTSTTMITPECSLPDLNHDQPRPVFAAGPQPRPATPSVRCRTSTTTIHAQCSLPDLQPRPATPSVRCRTSTTTSHAQCSLPDLNSYAKSYAR